jgi:dephospho-CoA kinase
MTRIIGLIGAIASGKTLVADYLVKEEKARYFRFSDVLRDILVRLHQADTRENLQSLGLGLRKTFGEGILAKAVRQDLAAVKGGLIVVDGIRYPDEFDMVKGLGGTIIFITAPQEVRHMRATRRGTRGEVRICLEDFKKCEEKETERLIEALGAKADYTITNTGTMDELRGEITRILRKIPP